jgi:hypothetical protein
VVPLYPSQLHLVLRTLSLDSTRDKNHDVYRT